MYLALYRKYRPKSFEDVISQPHITTTLKNQITAGQNAHAYLFTGSRGTGKTTCAKILAMALNCEHPVNGSPCMECGCCREIDSGAATDVVEMDAASNNKVEDVHLLQEQLAYTPVSCKYRVYIIDEVHMLSTAAFNALLKTLEEPPAHVIFILATTELHKVPATILSRCQRFEFRRIDPADSAERLMSVAKNEGVTLAPEAADMIARLSDGGMRDALSLLDRCISVSAEVTEETVRECTGAADNRHLYRLAEMTAGKDISGCIRLIGELYRGSADIAGIIDGLSMVFRDMMLSKTVPDDTALLSVMPADYPEIGRLADLYSLDDILRCLTLLGECADGISKTRQRRTAAEMCLVKMCTGAGGHTDTVTKPVLSSSVQAPPAKSGTVQIKPISAEPEESFELPPETRLSPKNAANLSRIREIFTDEAAPADMTPKADIPPEAPPVFPFDEVPLPEAPPEEYPAPSEPEAPPDEPSAQPAPAGITEAPAPDTAELTPEGWKDIISRLTPMYAAMLEDSEMSVSPGGALEIRSDNIMLREQVKNSSQPLEKELESVLGRKVRAVVVPLSEAPDSAADENPVRLLLEKAKRLNIEVQYNA